MVAAWTGALVGRNGEFEQLAQIGLQPADCGVEVVVVRGEAGIGKTALVRRWTAAVIASSTETVIATGHAVPLAGGAIPYGVASDLLSDLVDEVGVESALAALGAAAAQSLAGLVPSLATTGAPQPVDRGAVFRASQRLLKALTTERLVVLVVEDLHWADEASCDLVKFWANTLSRSRLVLVVTSRDVGEPDEIVARLGALERLPVTTCVALRPLADDEVTALVRHLTDSLNEGDLDRIRALSAGVPLYVEELVASGADGLPRTLRLDLANRLTALGERGGRVLQVAALEPRGFDIDTLGAVAVSDAEEVGDAIDRGLEEGLLDPEGAGRWRFHHELLREAVADTLTPSAARTAHRRWAERLGEAGDDAPLDDLIAAAGHWRAVGRSREALDALVRSAYTGARRGHHGLMAILLREALDLDLAGVALASPEEHDQILADYLGSIPIVDQVEAIIDAERERVDKATDVRRIWLDLELATTTGAMTAAAVVSMREALSRHPSDPLARVTMSKLMRVHLGLGDDKAALIETMDSLLEMDRFRGANVVIERAEWLSFIDDDLDNKAHYRMWSDALASASTQRDREQALARLVHGLVGLGRLEDGLDRSQEFFTLAPGPEQSKWWYIVAKLAAHALELLGRWSEAEGLYRRVAVRDGFDDGLRVGLAALVFMAMSKGDEAAVGELGEEIGMLAAPPGRGVIGFRERFASDIVLAHVVAAADPVRARALLVPALQVMSMGEEIRPQEEALLLAARIVGVEPEAEAEFCDVTLRAARSRLYDGPLDEAWLREVEARVGAAQGRATPDDWRAVVERWDSLSVPFHAAESRLAWADLLLHEGDRDQARDVLSRALEQAEALGAAPLAREVRGLAARGGVRLPGDRVHAQDGGLTRRELEVLSLLASGSTNEEIGRALFMSSRTASVHVSHILAKLGATNRTEAGAVARLRGLA